jgi:hypothetical protein
MFRILMVELQFFFDPKKDQASEGNAHGKACGVEQTVNGRLPNGPESGAKIVPEHARLLAVRRIRDL